MGRRRQCKSATFPIPAHMETMPAKFLRHHLVPRWLLIGAKIKKALVTRSTPTLSLPARFVGTAQRNPHSPLNVPLMNWAGNWASILLQCGEKTWFDDMIRYTASGPHQTTP